MSSLNSVFSLIRLREQKWVDGRIYWVAGRLSQFDRQSITLENQNEKKTFYINCQTTYVSQQHKPIHHWLNNLCRFDHLLLKTQYTNKQFTLLQIEILTRSQRQPLSWNPQASQQWYGFMKEVESFFIQSGFYSVQTPCLVECPGTEPQLRFFSTTYQYNKYKKKLWLASSPEIHLKKILCRGATDIFEIHKCFRNQEFGDHHLLEFFMLEWYRAYASLIDLITDLENLLKYLNQKLTLHAPTPSFSRSSIQDLFCKYCSIQLTPQSTAEELSFFLTKKEVPHQKNSSFEDLFHLIFLHFIEPQFNPETCMIVYNYPPSLRANSKLTEEGWADRFEWYWRGIELGNAFNEITDWNVQKTIFEKDIQQHTEEKLHIDRSFLSEMKTGFPPTSGIAVGLERLFMACYKKSSLPNKEWFQNCPST